MIKEYEFFETTSNEYSRVSGTKIQPIGSDLSEVGRIIYADIFEL